MSIESHKFRPARLHASVAKAATPIMLPYATFKMLVTPNWRVKPTAAIARIDAVTRPKPIEGTSTFVAQPPRAARPQFECAAEPL